MRMQKEEKIVVVLLLMALGSLAVAFWAFAPEEGDLENSPGSEIQKDSGLTIEGMVTEIKPTKSGGNLILRLDSTALPIFVSSGAGAGEIKSKVHLGDQLRIRGRVSEFQGTEEVEVDRVADVVRLN